MLRYRQSSALYEIESSALYEIERQREAIARLSREKRHIKQQLKEYDVRFMKKHGRPPLKFEKEPIRALYEAYHAIKARLATQKI